MVQEQDETCPYIHTMYHIRPNHIRPNHAHVGKVDVSVTMSVSLFVCLVVQCSVMPIRREELKQVVLGCDGSAVMLHAHFLTLPNGGLVSTNDFFSSL